MSVDLKGFHTIYINCFINTDAINNTDAFSVMQSEFPELLTMDKDDRAGKIKKVIEKIRVAVQHTKGEEFLKDCKSKSTVKNGAAFLQMFDPQIPFEKLEKVQTLYIGRIKALQDELEKYQIKDVAEFLNNGDFFTEYKPKITVQEADTSKAKIQILAKDFHRVYRECFIERPFHSSSQNINIQRLFFSLVLMDEKDREGKISEVVKELRACFVTNDGKENNDFLLLQTEARTESIPGGRLFLAIFSPKMPFEKDANVRKICIERIKTLQDDVQKLGIKDEASLTKCVYDPDFFWEKTATESSKQVSSNKAMPEIHYTRSSIEGVELFKGNLFSETELSRLSEGLRGQIVNIREDFVLRAKRGELINEKITYMELPYGKSTIDMYPNDLEKYPFYPFCVTLNSLVYDEIENNRIQTKEEAQKFILYQISHVPLFVTVFATKDCAGTLANVLSSLDQFDDTFKRIQERKQEPKQ